LQQREHLLLRELLLAVQELQLGHKAAFKDIPAETLDHIYYRRHCAAGGKHVIGNQDVLSRLDSVGVDLQGVGTVLEVISLFEGLERELPRLSHQNHPGSEFVGKRRSDDESTCLYTHDLVDLLADVAVRHEIDHLLIELRITEKCGYILENDPFFRKVTHIPDYILQCLHIVPSPVLEDFIFQRCLSLFSVSRSPWTRSAVS